VEEGLVIGDGERQVDRAFRRSMLKLAAKPQLIGIARRSGRSTFQ